MADVVVEIEKFKADEDRIADLERRLSTLSGGGGPPYDGSMEKRIAKLEATIPTLATKESVVELSGKIDVLAERLSGDIRAMDERLSGRIDTLNERTSHMPTKIGVIGIVATLLALFGALIVFQDRIQTFFGITQ